MICIITIKTTIHPAFWRSIWDSITNRQNIVPDHGVGAALISDDRIRLVIFPPAALMLLDMKTQYRRSRSWRGPGCNLASRDGWASPSLSSPGQTCFSSQVSRRSPRESAWTTDLWKFPVITCHSGFWLWVSGSLMKPWLTHIWIVCLSPRVTRLRNWYALHRHGNFQVPSVSKTNYRARDYARAVLVLPYVHCSRFSLLKRPQHNTSHKYFRKPDVSESHIKPENNEHTLHFHFTPNKAFVYVHFTSF